MDAHFDGHGREEHIAVLSPHFDDAVLSCWHALDDVGDVTVVNVFSGSPPPGSPVPWWDRLTGATDPVARMRERREEDRCALAVAGRAPVDLGLLDDQYRSDPPSVDTVVERLEGALPPRATVYAPAALGDHPDHQLVRSAALALARGGRRVALYADLPHAIRLGWPSWVTGASAAPRADVGAAWTAVLARAGLVTSRLVPRVRPLDARARDRKLRALAAYRTQRAALDRLAFVALADARALAWEVTWEVPRSALCGGDEPGGEPVVADAGCEAPDRRR